MNVVSGMGPVPDRPNALVLRLLPFVHRPPSRVLVLGAGHDARALDARGYRVTVLDLDQGDDVLVAEFGGTHFGGGYDLVCEHGAFATMDAPRYAAAAARALRPGGQLFGAFPGNDVGRLIRAFADDFEPTRLQPGGFADGALEAIFTRR